MSRRGKTPPPAAASLGGPLPERGEGFAKTVPQISSPPEREF